MRQASVLLIAVLLSSACAARQASASRPPAPPPEPGTLTFRESLEPETRICVPRDPFMADIVCINLGELRRWLRRQRLVRFEDEEP